RPQPPARDARSRGGGPVRHGRRDRGLPGRPWALLARDRRDEPERGELRLAREHGGGRAPPAARRARGGTGPAEHHHDHHDRPAADHHDHAASPTPAAHPPPPPPYPADDPPRGLRPAPGPGR